MREYAGGTVRITARTMRRATRATRSLTAATLTMLALAGSAANPEGAEAAAGRSASRAEVRAETGQEAPPADAAAIKDVVRKYVAAREENDKAAVTALFTLEADQLVSSGEWRRGREALVAGAMASSQASSGKRTVTVETIRLVAPTVALADGPYEIAASPGNAARRMWSSFVMVKQADGGWRIAAIRNMLPAPPPPPAAGGR